MTLSKPVSEGDWGAGYVAQMWFGPDAVGFNTSFPNAFGAGGTAGRVAALRSVADSSSLRTAEFSSSFVLLEYFGYLRRNPDPAGYNFWLNKLNAFNGNFVNAEMVKAFISSSEYRRRFGP